VSEIPQPEAPLTAEELALIASLSTAEVDAIDRALLANTHRHWRKVAMVVGKTMGELTNRRHGIPDTYYAQRVRKLVEDRALESQGNLAFMRFSEVRLPQSTDQPK
jgi:hypothetical protein